MARHYAWRTLALESWDEAAHRSLMRVLERGGQRNRTSVHVEELEHDSSSYFGARRRRRCISYHPPPSAR